MGQKTNPISNRVGIIRGWDSNWYGDYPTRILEDSKIREYLNVDERLFSWDYIFEPLTALFDDGLYFEKYSLILLSSKTSFCLTALSNDIVKSLASKLSKDKIRAISPNISSLIENGGLDTIIS